MKRTLCALIAAVVCSGQMCGAPVEDSGPQNVCDRSYYNETYGIGLTPPVAQTSAPGDALDGVVLQEVWTWDAVEPAIDFNLYVVQPTSETTLAEFRQVWLDQLATDSKIAVTESHYETLDSGRQGWVVSITSTDKPGQISKIMMTSTRGQLAYLRVVYPDTLTADQIAQIDAVLTSLCSDAE